MSCSETKYGATLAGNMLNGYADGIDKLTDKKFLTPFFAKAGNFLSIYNIANYILQGNQAEAEQAAVTPAVKSVQLNLGDFSYAA